jgi:hypothetical protein
VPLRKGLIVSLFAVTLLVPGEALGAPAPVEPIEIANGAQIADVEPHVSPAGRQFATYRSLAPTPELGLVERVDGGPFTSPAVFATTANAEAPSVSFTPDGGIHLIWGIATSGATAQQTFRPPAGEFVPASPLTGCSRFVDSAASPAGAIAVACSQRALTNPPDSYGLGISPALGPVTVSETLASSPVYDPFIQPKVAWGRDGTLAVVAAYKLTTVNPPPMNEIERSRVTIRNPATGVDATVDFDTPEPNELSFVGDPTVLDDGTVALAAAGTVGARVFIRPPGPATSFSPKTLTGVGVGSVQADAAQNLHAMSADPEPPTREYWSSVMSSAGGEFGAPVPVPLAGSPDPYIPFEGFKVAPDGTEYVLIRSDDGNYATSRSPGDATFAPPRRIGPASTGNPNGAVTADGDLLVGWTVENGPDDQSAYIGGLDGTPPKVTVESFPVRGTAGAELSFAASATDAMGLDSVRWDFGAGGTVAGDTATRAFGPGDHEVSFVAVDRAGNETVERRTVTIPGTAPDALKVKVRAPKKLKFRKLARKGVRVKVTASRAVRIRATIGIKRKGKLRPLRVKSVKKAKVRHTIRVKPKKKRLGKRRKFRLTVKVRATTRDGTTAARTKKVKIRP